MQWEDQGLVLSLRRHGERDVIIETITRAHGRHLGLVRGGRSQKQAPFLQPGNTVQLVWRARLEEHLGQFCAEPQVNRVAKLLSDPLALNALGHVSYLIRLLPERENHGAVFEAAEGLCELFGHSRFLALNLARFEVMILTELGFGLDFSRCGATGQTEDLVYVSPKSGRAICREAGLPWHDKLLPLPEFLRARMDLTEELAEIEEIEAGFGVSEHFLNRHVLGPRNLAPSPCRAAFLERFLRRVCHPKRSRSMF
jgi:DNA repair protein RecO (recombination protein O)